MEGNYKKNRMTAVIDQSRDYFVNRICNSHRARNDLILVIPIHFLNSVPLAIIDIEKNKVP